MILIKDFLINLGWAGVGYSMLCLIVLGLCVKMVLPATRKEKQSWMD